MKDYIKIARVCYNQGILRLEAMPSIRFATEASLYRKADELGYTHVCIRHGFLNEDGKSFTIKDIPPDTRKIPKRYRIGK